ncbi:MAG: hypothetical protein GXO63_01265 [Candidatus Micrarchaeota archaeon]|nr:hypothetical protein [Candidatus Micrarchaeota archaeon]
MKYVKDLVKIGVIVPEDVLQDLEKLSPDEFENLKKFLENKNKAVLERKDVLLFKKITPEELSKIYMDYFEFFRKILAEKNVPVSISSCKFGEVYTIGMVAKIEKDYILLEDPTGFIKTVIKNGPRLVEDDVIGVSGIVNNGILFAKKVYFPDIPVKNAVVTEREFKIKYSGEDISVKDVNPEYDFFTIESVKILVYRNKTGFTGLELLKRRTLEPGNVFTDKIIRTVPDVFLTTGKDETLNYKGTTIVSVSSKTAEINLKTREVNYL